MVEDASEVVRAGVVVEGELVNLFVVLEWGIVRVFGVVVGDISAIVVGLNCCIMFFIKFVIIVASDRGSEINVDG
jgi:hypothetical protein